MGFFTDLKKGYAEAVARRRAKIAPQPQPEPGGGAEPEPAPAVFRPDAQDNRDLHLS
jgi:hypothetical protein